MTVPYRPYIDLMLVDVTTKSKKNMKTLASYKKYTTFALEISRSGAVGSSLGS